MEALPIDGCHAAAGLVQRSVHSKMMWALPGLHRAACWSPLSLQATHWNGSMATGALMA